MGPGVQAADLDALRAEGASKKSGLEQKLAARRRKKEEELKQREARELLEKERRDAQALEVLECVPEARCWKAWRQPVAPMPIGGLPMIGVAAFIGDRASVVLPFFPVAARAELLASTQRRARALDAARVVDRPRLPLRGLFVAGGRGFTLYGAFVPDHVSKKPREGRSASMRGSFRRGPSLAPRLCGHASHSLLIDRG